MNQTFTKNDGLKTFSVGDTMKNIGEITQTSLNFVKQNINTKTANLDLIVETVEVFDVAIGKISRAVAGLIKTLPRIYAERIGNEPLRG